MIKDRWVEHRLEIMERPKVLYEYYVTGGGQFPYDMLRFDHCWPASGADADKLFNWDSIRYQRSIMMRSYRPPTVDRWSSFIWSVGTKRLEFIS